MGKWEMVRLGDICNVLNGFAFESKYYAKCGHRVIRITNVQKGKIVDDDPKFYTEEDGLEKFELLSNDLLMSLTGNVGRVGLIQDSLLPAYLNQRVACIRTKESTISKRYLYSFLNSDEFEKDAISSSKGLAQKNMSTEWLKEYEIPLPPKPIQQKIADALDKASALIEMRKAQIEKLDLLIKSQFIEMFGDSAIIKQEWKVTSLGVLADIVSGVTKGRKLTQQTFDTPYIRVANVKDGFLDLKEVKTIPATADEIIKFGLRNYDVLMTEGGDPDKLGRGAVWNGSISPCIHQNHIFRLRLNAQHINPIFFAWFLLQPVTKKYFLRSAKQTTGIASINMNQLKRLPVYLPPINLQDKFAMFVERVEEQKKFIQVSLDEMKINEKSLMQKCFSGEMF